MKKLIVLVILIVAVAGSPLIMAKNDNDKGNEKYWVCHWTSLISDGDLYTAISGSLIPEGEPVGQMLHISEKAVPAHCRHGDRVFDFEFLPEHLTPAYGLCRPDRSPGPFDIPCDDF